MKLPPLLRTRLLSELGDERAWLAPDLRKLVAPIKAVACLVDAIEEATVAAIWADTLGERGLITPSIEALASARPECRLLVVMNLSAGGRLVAQQNTARRLANVRVLADIGVLELTSAGLVIVELASSVSALDLQRYAEPTLFISPAVRAMGS